MKKITIIIVFVIICCLVIFTACGNVNNNSNNNIDSIIDTDDEPISTTHTQHLTSPSDFEKLMKDNEHHESDQ